MMVYQPAIDITWKTVAKVVPQYANVTAIVYFAIASSPFTIHHPVQKCFFLLAINLVSCLY
jgi:hypothetical protein